MDSIRSPSLSIQILSSVVGTHRAAGRARAARRAARSRAAAPTCCAAAARWPTPPEGGRAGARGPLAAGGQIILLIKDIKGNVISHLLLLIGLEGVLLHVTT